MPYTQSKISGNKEKKSNPVVCSKMNKTARYYAKWNNTGREQQMSHVLPPEISNKSWN